MRRKYEISKNRTKAILLCWCLYRNDFKQNDIHLSEKYHFITNIEQAKQFLLENCNNDILICCHCATLYDSPQENWGHMVLFESINMDDTITLLDPSPNRDYEVLSLEKLIEAIVTHGIENGAGFYLIQ